MIDYEAEVERVLDGPPSTLAFRALCAALNRAGGPEDLLARCAERLASWPDEVRQAPWSWPAALTAGYPKPAWPLVRSLALKPASLGVRDAVLPDPRSRPEVRGVSHLDLGWFSRDALAALAESMAHWENLRSVRAGYLTELDEDVVATLAGNPAVTRLESLVLVDVREDMWHFEKPPFRPAGEQPLRLRHVGLRAPDLVRLLRSGRLPALRSAEVLVCDVEEARDLADCRALARLDRLAIGFRCGKNGRQPLGKPFFGNVIDDDDDACEVFFARADLASLRALTVRGIQMGQGREGLGARGVAAIVASGVPRRLTELTLELLPVGDATVAAVVRSVDAERIEKLTLADLVVTDVTTFAGAFPRLRHLDLSHNRIGPAAARRLATGVALPALTHLDLSGRPGGSPYYRPPDVQPIGDEGAEALAAAENVGNLTSLNLAATGLGMAGLTALMSSTRLGKLETLDVSRNPVGGWPSALRNSPVWRGLRSLDVAECGLDDDGVESLAATTSAPHLHGVSLAYNSIGSRGARALAAWPLLPRLWELNLHDNIIADDGLIALATSRAARRLLELDLEQDCWNARARRSGAPLPAEVTDQESFPNLDAIFLGVVDEYHGARYSCGFPADVRAEIATARPELAAFLTHLDMEEDEDLDDPEWESERADHDFRTRRAERHASLIDEAREFTREVTERDDG